MPTVSPNMYIVWVNRRKSEVAAFITNSKGCDGALAFLVLEGN